MINPKKIHQQFKFKYNKLDSNHKQDFPPAFIDDLANSALFYYVEMFYSGNNSKAIRMGFEVTQQRMDMLSDFVIPAEVEGPKELIKHPNGVYEFSFGDLKYTYKHLVRTFVSTDCGIINITPKQHDDLNILLNDEYQKPSRAWKRIPSKIAKSSKDSGSSLYLYTNEEFTIDTIQIEYLKAPDKIFSGGYDTLDFLCGEEAPSKESDPIKTDLSECYLDTLVDIMVALASDNLNDANQLNIREQRIIKTV